MNNNLMPNTQLTKRQTKEWYEAQRHPTPSIQAFFAQSSQRADGERIYDDKLNALLAHKPK